MNGKDDEVPLKSQCKIRMHCGQNKCQIIVFCSQCYKIRKHFWVTYCPEYELEVYLRSVALPINIKGEIVALH